MTNSEQLKKDRELLERFNSSVKNKYIFNPVELLAAQERVTREETKKYVDDIICDWGMNLEINADEVMDLRKDINLI